MERREKSHGNALAAAHVPSSFLPSRENSQTTQVLPLFSLSILFFKIVMTKARSEEQCCVKGFFQENRGGVVGLEGEVRQKCQEPDHLRYSCVTSSEESTGWQSSV